MVNVDRMLITLVLWALGLLLMWHIPTLKSRRDATTAKGHLTTLSVIVPARNEAARIAPLLSSVQTQTLQPLEVLVVDDGSTDDTASLARAFDAKVITASSLPAGWSGKNWACWQGAQAARGDLLLFLDADTWLAEDACAALVETHLAVGGLISAQPYHETERPYEQLSALFNIVLMAAMNAFTPLGRRVRPAGAFGPCSLCSRSDYERVGGHGSVRDQLLEQIGLAKRFARQKLPVHCFGGQGAISFRMYPEGLAQMIEGWSKGFGSGALAVGIPSLVLTIGWISGCFRTAIDLTRALLGHDVAQMAAYLGLYVLFALQIHWMLRRIGRFQTWAWTLFPIPLLFFGLVMLRSLALIHLRRRVTWRGRSVPIGERPHDSATFEPANRVDDPD